MSRPKIPKFQQSMREGQHTEFITGANIRRRKRQDWGGGHAAFAQSNREIYFSEVGTGTPTTCHPPPLAQMLVALYRYAYVGAGGKYVLEPVSSRSLGIARRGTPQTSLQNQTTLFWGHDIGDASIFMNVTVKTGDDEMVLSTEYFHDTLQSVKCDNSLSLTFNSNDSYTKAIADWSWVNFNAQRTFIMIVNYGGCDDASGRQPWVVSQATYNNANLTVHFDAVQKAWKDLNVPLAMEWGKYINTNQNQKRFGIGPIKIPPIGPISIPPIPIPTVSIPPIVPVLTSVLNTVQSSIPTLNQDITGFDVHLDHTLDSTFLNPTLNNGLNFSLACNDCSTKGSLNIGGHIDLGVSGPPSISLTATASGISLDLNLEATLSGTQTSPWQKDIILVTAPATPFEILGIVSVGPEVQFDAGFVLSNVQGSATIGSGATAAIPDGSSASVNPSDLSGAKFTGWKPDITLKPLTVDAEIDGNLTVYVKVSANVGLDILDGKWGAGIGVALQVPDINFEVAAKASTKEGACTGSTDMFEDHTKSYSTFQRPETQDLP
ncbi:hypothetical protein G7Y89_g15054 [Cudoniella acicularis]|uniref:Uncharacterized protein n=1 Tax=Cudoniella acicularis TaxID=354080 RepID=A0A8H4QUD7_9HELO|nr:hypothetical protein G7Y89_g15054 [Cudoniella acicularis]